MQPTCLGGGGGGWGGHTITLCIFTGNSRMLEELHGVMSQVQAGGWESQRSWREFLLLAVKELMLSANGFLNRQTKGTINAENIGTKLKLWFIVHLIAHEYGHKTDSTEKHK